MNRFTTCFALVFASTLGCGVEPDGNLADVASQEQALFGVPDPGPAQPVSAPHRPGVVQITIPGDPVVRTGLLVSPDLVMVSRRWFSSNTVAADLRIRHGISSILLPAPERPGWTLTINDSMPMAFIQVFNPFPNVPPVTFSSRGPAQLLGTSASCFGFDSGTVFWQREQNIVAVGGGREVLGSTPINLLQDRHAGAPCFDSGGAVIGFLLSTEGSLASYRSRIHATFDARSFIDNMLRVARLRRLPGAPTLGFKIETSVGFTPMCIEVPHGDPFALSIPANVVPCQAGRNNQRWFLDYSNLNGPAFVSALTGTCIDVPGGSTMPNALLGMSSCNGGTNQAWTGTFRSTLSPASSPLDFRYAPARRSLCLVPAERFFAIPSRLTQDVCSFQPYAREEWAFNW